MDRRKGLKTTNLDRPRRQCRAERSRPRDLDAHFATVKKGNWNADHQGRFRFGCRQPRIAQPAAGYQSIYTHSPRFLLSVSHCVQCMLHGDPKEEASLLFLHRLVCRLRYGQFASAAAEICAKDSVRRLHRVAIDVCRPSGHFFSSAAAI
jgi:hypothetical protein